MYNIVLNWKEFNVSLPNLHAHLKAEYPELNPQISADSKLTIHLSQQPSAEIENEITAHWDSLDGSDYKSQEQLNAEATELAEAIADAKVAMLSKTWDQLSAVEKKIAMNMEVSRAEMGLE